MSLCTWLLHFLSKALHHGGGTPERRSAERADVNFAKTVCSSVTRGLELNQRATGLIRRTRISVLNAAGRNKELFETEVAPDHPGVIVSPKVIK